MTWPTAGCCRPGSSCSASPGATGGTASSPTSRAPRRSATARTEFREEVWKRLADSIRFVPGSFDDDDAFDRLCQQLVDLEQSHGITGNAAFYLSIPPPAFPAVLKQMERTGLASNEQAGWLAPGRRREAVRP